MQHIIRKEQLEDLGFKLVNVDEYEISYELWKHYKFKKGFIKAEISYLNNEYYCFNYVIDEQELSCSLINLENLDLIINENSI